MNIRRKAVVSLWVLSFCFLAPAMAAATNFVPQAQGFLSQLIKLSDISREKQGQADAGASGMIKTLSAQIDFTSLAQRSLGGARWKTLKASERDEFLATLQELLEVVVYPEARKISSKDDALKYQPVAGKAERVSVTGTIEQESRGEILSKSLQLQLIFDKASGKIVDAVLEKEQISVNLKRQFDQALKKQKFSDILGKMKKRVEQARESSAGVKKSVTR